MRDYIHVMDLARGHVAAISKMKELKGETVINLGTGIHVRMHEYVCFVFCARVFVSMYIE